MADIRPFGCIRPVKEAAPKVAALPYDIYSRQEAKKEVEKSHVIFGCRPGGDPVLGGCGSP